MILTFPLTRPESLLESTDPAGVITFYVIGFLYYMAIVPILTSLSAYVVHVVARALGGSVPLRRTLRVAGAWVFWLMVIGIVYHLIVFGTYFLQESLPRSFLRQFPDFNIYHFISNPQRLLLQVDLVVMAWYFGWTFGGLYRLSLWKALILVVSAYFVLVPIWLYLLFGGPMHAIGLL
jgi:hypothetical protein